jgi:hypothetical protein
LVGCSYQEATAAAIDWSLVFDGKGEEWSFEEAHALYRAIK